MYCSTLPAQEVHLADTAPGQNVSQNWQADGAVDEVGHSQGHQEVVCGLSAQPGARQQGMQGSDTQHQACAGKEHHQCCARCLVGFRQMAHCFWAQRGILQ